MIFKPVLIAKIIAGEKWVTRRPYEEGKRCHYVCGKTYSIQPGMARPSVARIRVLDVWPQALGDITNDDAIAEGFPLDDSPTEFARAAFLAYWSGLYGGADLEQTVWRIRFELVEIVAECCPTCDGKGVVPLAEDCHEPAGPYEIEAWNGVPA